MGMLLHTATDGRHPLATRTIVGRNPMTQLWIEDRRTSNEHAVLWFEDGEWWVKDLRSRNGTYVGAHRLEAEQARSLKRGETLCFGRPDDAWVLIDDSPPTAYAIRSETHQLLLAQDELLLIPSADEPTVAVFADGLGGWSIENDGQLRTGKRVQEIQVNGEYWTLYLPFQHMSTWTDNRGGPVLPGIHFLVSSDEEHVEMEIRTDENRRLPARSHTYFLLILARQRIEDQAAGLNEAEQGWLHISDLCRMLKIDRATVNQRVFRARQQLASAGGFPAAEVIERRSQSGQMRLGTSLVSEGPF